MGDGQLLPGNTVFPQEQQNARLNPCGNRFGLEADATMTRLSTAESMVLVVLNVFGAIGYDIATSRGGWKYRKKSQRG